MLLTNNDNIICISGILIAGLRDSTWRRHWTDHWCHRRSVRPYESFSFNGSKSCRWSCLRYVLRDYDRLHRCCEKPQIVIFFKRMDLHSLLFQESGSLYKLLIESPNFRVTVVSDAITVEMCGALKNIVAVGAGFVDGLKLGDNTKVDHQEKCPLQTQTWSPFTISQAAVIRIGLMEMVKYVREYGGDTPILATFFESCGVADLVRRKSVGHYHNLQ